MVSEEQLAFATVAQLATMLRAHEVTSIELTTLFLERLARIGTALNAVVTLTPELALEQAKRADAELERGVDRGPLHGIPYGAKDLLATVGYPTTWGMAPLREQQLDFDAAVIERMAAAGAVLVAKLAMVEGAGGFGYTQPNAALTGPGRNAWNREYWAGGSSSGSGAAVAAGCVPMAIGTETWGSIHVPAAYNGLSGLRPTFGLVSRYGAMALSWTMDKIGPMARTATDCEAMLQALAGPDVRDAPTLVRPALRPDPRRTGFQFATFFDSDTDVEPEVAVGYQRALEVLREIGSVTEIELPRLPYDEAASIVIAAEGTAAFEEFLVSGKADLLTAPEDHVALFAALSLPATDYIRAQRLRTRAINAMHDVIAPFDAVVAPAYPNVATPITSKFSEEPKSDARRTIDGAANLCGLPGLALPAGFGRNGLPVSISLTGRVDADAAILAAGAAYQSRTEWHLATPASLPG